MLNFDATTYSKTAEFFAGINLEEQLNSFSETFLVPAIGDLQNFPRITPETRAIGRGVDFLQKQIDETVVKLKTLAAIAEKDLQIPQPLEKLLMDLFIVQMDLEVRPFILHFQKNFKGKAAKDEGGDQEKKKSMKKKK